MNIYFIAALKKKTFNYEMELKKIAEHPAPKKDILFRKMTKDNRTNNAEWKFEPIFCLVSTVCVLIIVRNEI